MGVPILLGFHCGMLRSRCRRGRRPALPVFKHNLCVPHLTAQMLGIHPVKSDHYEQKVNTCTYRRLT
jgi:hypothetical protein